MDIYPMRQCLKKISTRKWYGIHSTYDKNDNENIAGFLVHCAYHSFCERFSCWVIAFSSSMMVGCWWLRMSSTRIFSPQSNFLVKVSSFCHEWLMSTTLIAASIWCRKACHRLFELVVFCRNLENLPNLKFPSHLYETTDLLHRVFSLNIETNLFNRPARNFKSAQHYF